VRAREFHEPSQLALVVFLPPRHAASMSTVSRARRLRREMPDAQRRLWRLLRDRRFAGYKFRREHPMGRYFLDFYCPEARLNLELDGGQHGLPEQRQHDELKEQYLLSRGILTTRFWNHQVQREPEVVKENLWRILQERAPHPGNVPSTPNARSRTWPGHQPTERVPLRPNRRMKRVDSELLAHPSPQPSPRGGERETR
jgi:very-short-patch-repair endonuclease